MVMKDSYDFNVKNEVREKLRDFVSRAYPGVDQRRNLHVLTLLGHEDNELKQVWDPLGVPRKNITTLENNPQAYEIVKNMNFGVNLIKGNVNDYIPVTNKKFDVINLDYQGYYNFDKFRIMEEIAYNQMLGNKGVLATWYSGRREKGDILDYHKINNMCAMRTLSDILMDSTKDFDLTIKNNLINHLKERREQLNAGEIRSDSISEDIILSFAYPLINFEQHPLVKKLGFQKEYDNYISNTSLFIQRNRVFLKAALENKSLKEADSCFGFGGFTEEAFEAFKRIRKNVLDNKPISEADKDIFYLDLHVGGLDKVNEVLKRKVEGTIGNSFSGYTTPISVLIGQYYTNPMFVLDNLRLNYKSDNGTPMIVDFNCFGKKDFSKTLDWKLKSDGKLEIPLKQLTTNKFFSSSREFQDLSTKYFLANWPGRKHIEFPKQENKVNLSTSPTGDKKLSNEEVYSLIEHGKTNEEIIKIDPSLTSGKIGARRAWITMREEKGNIVPIEENKLEEATEVEKVDEKSEEELSREGAIFLLKQGIGTKEILEAYPNAFTDYQLRGYKAQVTAGRL